ncbi:MAG: LemA family protein [Nanoarchaeota archaeon]
MNKKGLLGTLAIILIVLGAIALLLVGWAISGYNKFYKAEQDVDGKWSEVENQYQTQADKIPNLVSIVSSSVSVETKFVKDVIAARTAYVGASSQLAKDAAGQQMNNGISAFVSAVAENYPQLQASAQYTQLMDELSGTQNRIATSRGRYIESIQSYNTATGLFPGKILASIFGFEKKDYYKSEAGTTTPQLGTGILP